jgi:hypothetical protein
MATEQTTLRQIDQNGATRGQGLFWDGLKWIVSTVSMLFTISVASTNASAFEKLFANYVCDGTADDIEINQALQDVKVKGGTVQLSAGIFNISAPLFIEGDNDPTTAPNVGLVGVGGNSTTLDVANNIDCIILRYMPKPKVKDLKLVMRGTGSGIRSIALTTGSTDRRGFWQGEFKGLNFAGVNHTGWAMNLEQPFRSEFSMIQSGSGLANGIWIKSTFSGFNPGNNTFKNIMMGLDVPNGTAYRLWSDDNGGQMNLNTFEICDCIDASSTSTTSVGWDFRGSTTTYFSTKNNTIISSNVEGFNTGAKFVNASDNDVNLTFADCKNGGTIVDFSPNSQRNKVQVRSGYVPPNQTQYLVVDANTSQQNPNTVGGFNAYVETGATLTCTLSKATIIKECISSGPGTINPLLARYTLPSNQIQKINVSSAAPTNTQVLGYSSDTNEWAPTFVSGLGINQQVIQVDFGVNEDGMVTIPVTATWVTATSEISVEPAGTATSDHDPDDYGLEGVSGYVSNIVPGSGFDLTASARDTTWGKYNFNIIYQ